MKWVALICMLFSVTGNSYSQGLIFNNTAYDNSPVKAHLTRGDGHSIPTAASIKQYCPRPGNQLDYNTSVAWSIAWQARTILYARENNITNTDEKIKYIYSPSYIYQIAKRNNDENCEKGITLEAGLDVVKNQGVPGLNDFLFFCGGEVTQDIHELAKANRISGYSKLYERSDPLEMKLKNVKRSIAEGFPVIIGVISPPSFKRAKEFWQPKEKPTIEYGGQALCVIGFDDNKYGGAFEVVNSWGNKWGNEGFMWIRYGDFDDFVKYAYELFVIPKSKTSHLGGKVIFKLNNGEEMLVADIGSGHYKMKETYSSGTNFRVYITNDDPSFVYVFGSDLTGDCFPIFPHKESISAAVTYKSEMITIPDEKHYIQFDDTAGTDYLCVVYSREELDFKGILKQIADTSGNFHERVNTVFGNRLLNNSIDWDTQHIKFSTDSNSGSLAAAVIEIEHN